MKNNELYESYEDHENTDYVNEPDQASDYEDTNVTYDNNEYIDDYTEQGNYDNLIEEVSYADLDSIAEEVGYCCGEIDTEYVNSDYHTENTEKEYSLENDDYIGSEYTVENADDTDYYTENEEYNDYSIEGTTSIEPDYQIEEYYEEAYSIGDGTRSHLRNTNRTVTFNGNGGTPASQQRTVQSGRAIGTLPQVSRSGHNFLGWFTAATGGSQITTNTIVNGNATVFARWQVQTVNVTLTVNVSSWNPASGAASGSFTITTNQALSTIQSISNVNWLTVSGTGATRAMSVSANTGTAARTGTITVRTSNGSIARTISVTQVANTATLMVNVSSWNPASGATSGSFTITTNQTLSTIQSISNVNWLTVSGTGATRTMSVTANTGTTARTGIITVRTSNGSIIRHISATQAGNTATLNVNISSWSPASVAVNASFTITTNQALSTIVSTSNANWLIASGTGATRTMSVSANTGTVARTGTIMVRTSNGSIGKDYKCYSSSRFAK